MEQRTCNIIMCCKNTEAGVSRKECVIRYLCQETGCEKEDYTDSELLSPILAVVSDYLDGCNKPSSFLNSYLEAGKYNSSIIDKILSALAMTQVRSGKTYINGFTPEQLKISEGILVYTRTS